MEYLEYDGQQLHWRQPGDGKGPASYNASSGLPGWQRPSEECIADAGPTAQHRKGCIVCSSRLTRRTMVPIDAR
jgi:hypothetical protein